MIGGRVKGAKRGSNKDLITYVDKPTRYVVRGARVGERRLTRRQARQAKSKKEEN